MKNFIIFFNAREGTSHLVRLLNNFEQINIIHHVNNWGWEPFDIHNCGPMSTKDLKNCFELIYSNKPLNMVRLNQIYTKTAKKPLEVFDKSKSIGFKMRFIHPKVSQPMAFKLPVGNRYLNYAIRKYLMQRFKKMIFYILRKYHIVTFIAIRQNVLGLALSDYHGDGHGNPGHLQFKLALGKIAREDIPKINVDCDRLEELISKWERILKMKKALMEKFKRSGIKTCALIYETFCDDKIKYFQEFFSELNIKVYKKEIETAIKVGSIYKKVHSDDISEFVINHKEVISRFGNRYFTWS